MYWMWLILAFLFGFFVCALFSSSKRRDKAEEESWKEKGFTLIELLVSVTIAMVVLGSMVNFFISQNRSYASNEVTLTTLQDIRLVVSTMVTDLRLAGYKPSTSVFSGVAVATDKSIRVVSDLNQDGDTADMDEDIAYAWNPDTKELTKNGALFLDSVQSLVFQYILQDGSIVYTPTNLTMIRKVTLSITVQSRNIDPLTMRPKTFNLVSDVTPRNLGL